MKGGHGEVDDCAAGREREWAGEGDARRLYRAVGSACAKQSGFAGRIDAGLAAALSFLAADPEVARGLALLEGDAQALKAQRRWVRKFGELIRDAAGPAPEEARGLRLREQFQVEGIRFLIGRQVLAGEAATLPDLRPDLHRILMAVYGSAPAAPESRRGAPC